ncbi:MAG: ATP-binding cassette domain-containing protein [Ilumatobacteraceae bacterium]
MGLTDVSFRVNEGQIFVVMGLSGSGKSTALHGEQAAHGDRWRGTRRWSGRAAMSGCALQEFRRTKMGMVFQHFALFPHHSVIDNVAYGLKVQGVGRHDRARAALQALDLVGLRPYASSMPAELSGGMQQRVGLARALASDPDILLMDEAFSALDPLIRRQMQDEMLAIQAELHKTILFITHDLNEALRIGDQVCIMKDGAVVQIGTPEQILTEPATGYVAEFVQDVDQGRVIQVHEIMVEPRPIERGTALSRAMRQLGDRSGAFVLDEAGRPMSVLTAGDGIEAAANGSDQLDVALRTDFERCSPNQTLNEVYAAAGRGIPIAVVDDADVLVGNLDPRHIMEELGRVETLIDGFEREVYL